LKATEIVLKTIVFAVYCLVLYSASGCNRKPEVHLPAVRQPSAEEFGYAHLPPLYLVIEPDSLEVPVVWNRSSLLFVRTVTHETTVESGDTILSGTDPFFAVEIQRLEMALDIAEVTGDSVAADSLKFMLSDSSSIVFITSPLTGTITDLATQGTTLQPGDTVAAITGAPPDSVYILVPAYNHIKWPEGLEGCRATDQGLRCTGTWPGETALLPGTWSVQQRFIYEDDLESFVVTTAADTVPVTIIGYTDTSKIVYSPFLLDSVALIPW